MPDLWRISNHDSLAGDGALKYAARWNSAGRRIVYLAASPAGAMIEVLVHLELGPRELPPAYSLLHVEVPEDVKIEPLIVLPGDTWKSDLALSHRLGDEWLARRTTALARVPSAILPNTFNYLLNPLHPAAERIRIVEAANLQFDPRLLKNSPTAE